MEPEIFTDHILVGTLGVDYFTRIEPEVSVLIRNILMTDPRSSGIQQLAITLRYN